MDNSSLAELRLAKAEWARIQCEFAALKMLFSGRQWIDELGREERDEKYRPDQPRVPAGNSDGGQWIGEGVATGVGNRLPRDADKPVHLALAPGIAAEKAAEAALYLYFLLASRNSESNTAALEFRAQEFLPGADENEPAIGVRQLTREDADEACPKHVEVQTFADEAADRVEREGNYWGASAYGTKVHAAIRDEVNSRSDPNFRAEVSLIKSAEVKYGKATSVRVDVLENVGDGSVCVYDIKTGESKLSLARMTEIAGNVHSRYPGTKKIIVIETRPKAGK